MGELISRSPPCSTRFTERLGCWDRTDFLGREVAFEGRTPPVAPGLLARFSVRFGITGARRGGVVSFSGWGITGGMTEGSYT